VWIELDGFDDSYFLYGEDCELGLRLWLTGHRVGVEPRARVIHDYVFDKGSRKWFLLERNRWRTCSRSTPLGLLALLAPALLVAELGLLVVAARDGWLARSCGPISRAARSGARGRRRAAVQAQRRIDDAAFAAPAQRIARQSLHAAAATRADPRSGLVFRRAFGCWFACSRCPC
jgi:GT2 family glycosyltransferase